MFSSSRTREESECVGSSVLKSAEGTQSDRPMQPGWAHAAGQMESSAHDISMKRRGSEHSSLF